MLIANVGLVTERTLGKDNWPTKDPSLGAPKRRNLRSEVRGGVHERPELVDLESGAVPEFARPKQTRVAMVTRSETYT